MVLSHNDYLTRAALEDMQAERLRALLGEILPQNEFYSAKFKGISPQEIKIPGDLAGLPFTTKGELLAEQEAHPPYGRLWTFPLDRYCRLHQSSGSTGRPLRWLDTAESWSWALGCWEKIYQIAGVQEDDRLFFPFSFGPFLGFWAAFDAAARLGRLCLPGGGMTSSARLRFLLDHATTVVLCTPTYALRLAEVAREESLDLAGSSVRLLILAGEPGASIPETRRQIETRWGARVLDHYGMTEIGPLGIECQKAPGGMHLLETECVAEVIDPESTRPVSPGQTGELVLTNLGRLGSPLIRYRTGDLVQVAPDPCPCGRPFMRLKDGILGRGDDLIYLRGNKVYPTALEALIRRFPEVAEYRVELDQTGSLPSLRVELEPLPSAPNDVAARVKRAIHDEFLFRAEVKAVLPGTLPRFELKTRRFLKINHERAGLGSAIEEVNT